MSSFLFLITVAVGGAGTAGLFGGMFFMPHAFGGRDGQSGAGLAALYFLTGGGVAIVSYALAVWSAWSLRGKVRRRTLVAGLSTPWIAFFAMAVFSAS